MNKTIQMIIIILGIIVSSIYLITDNYIMLFKNMDITKDGDIKAIVEERTDNLVQNLFESEVENNTKSRGVVHLKSVYSQYELDKSNGITAPMLNVAGEQYKSQLTEELEEALYPYIDAGFLEKTYGPTQDKYVDIQVDLKYHGQMNREQVNNQTVNNNFYNIGKIPATDGGVPYPDWEEEKHNSVDWNPETNEFRLADGGVVGGVKQQGTLINNQNGPRHSDLDTTYSEKWVFTNYLYKALGGDTIPEELEGVDASGNKTIFPEIKVTVKVKPHNVTKVGIDLPEIEVVTTGKLQHRNLMRLKRR